MNTFRLMQKLAERGTAGRKPHPGDWYSEDGLLMCGVCGKPREMRKKFRNPVPGDPDAYSELTVPVMCDCDAAEDAREARERQTQEDMRRIEELRRASLLDDRLSGATFENFEVTQFNGRNLQICRRYADRFEEMAARNQGLLFWGDVGTGKSFAAACIANQLLSQGVPVVMTSFVRLLALLQNGSDETDMMERLNRASLLILDDLGAERGTDYALEKVYGILDSRYRKCRPMILTTNLTTEQMKQTADSRCRRIYDRVFECCYPLQFAGRSWRRREAARRYSEMEKLLGAEE